MQLRESHVRAPHLIFILCVARIQLLNSWHFVAVVLIGKTEATEKDKADSSKTDKAKTEKSKASEKKTPEKPKTEKKPPEGEEKKKDEADSAKEDGKFIASCSHIYLHGCFEFSRIF